ncbi:hypothetical protein [Paenibacillus sp. P22]|uniref:hypothetical protein n=1 Tax=Paenibacillus sp. P22 TaxID=483908 RepID=UPI001E60636A|nr:hypothetical protein [Paenibacillus sp. P22]
MVLLKSKVENEELLNVLDLYLNGLQAYLPLEAIQAQLQQNPQNIDQRNIMKEQDATYIFDKLNTLDIDPGFIASLLKSEMFKGREF